jgi:hypothetical protein
MLKVVHPSTYGPERQYILGVVLGEWLGLEYVAEHGSVDCLQITCLENPTGGRLEVDDSFFQTPPAAWLSPESLPGKVRSWTPLAELGAGAAPLAVLYGAELDSGSYVMVQPGFVRIGVDIFGTAFYMLTRYEEIVSERRDEFDRFVARFSILQPVGLLDRAIVNEHVELLWRALHRLWPELVRTPRNYRCLLSCDVDQVSLMGASAWFAMRVIAGRPVRDALRNGSWRGAFRHAARLRQGWRGDPGRDDLDDFDFLMDQAEQVGCTFVFNLIAGHDRSNRDGIYGVHRGGIRNLMRRIHGRGHELGFHGSYSTYLDPDRLRREFTRLTRIAAEEGVTQATWGGRQHYLRWSPPITWQAYEDAGIGWDSTLTYADYAGFRCGTCYEFPVFNIKTRRTLRLRERPLIAMEKTLLARPYMGLSSSQAVDRVRVLSDACRRVNGDFSLLWHNGQTRAPEMRKTFAEMLAVASQPDAPPISDLSRRGR